MTKVKQVWRKPWVFGAALTLLILTALIPYRSGNSSVTPVLPLKVPAVLDGTSVLTSSSYNMDAGETGDIAPLAGPAVTVPVITTLTLPAACVGAMYQEPLTVEGGVSPYAWSLAGGSLPDGLGMDTSAGLIIGTPVTAGVYSINVMATDSAGTSTAKPFSITVVPFVSVFNPPDGDVGLPYSSFAVISGGAYPTGWRLTAGALPDGLAIDGATGRISGLPTIAGVFTFNVHVSGVSPQNISVTEYITINPAPAVVTTSLPGGKVADFYLESLALNGGTAPYSWSLAGGTLPDGLSFDSSGLITGIPTAAGVFSFTVQAIDSAGAIAKQNLSLMVNPAPDIITAYLPDGYINVPYAQSLLGSGLAPFTWSLTDGALPDGLALDPATGLLAGRPTTSGTTSFTVRLSDSAGGTAAQFLAITIGEPGLSSTYSPAPAIITTFLPGGKVNVYYEQTITASGAFPFTWSISNGSLPDGLSLSTEGKITGAPTAAGIYSFTVRVTDNAGGLSEQSLSITIS